MTDVQRFAFTDRCRPIVEVGIGDARIASSGGLWDTARWDTAGAVWSGVEPSWVDVTCDVVAFRCEYGRRRTTDRFVPGVATVVVDNQTGWADPNVTVDPFTLNMRPGRAIRMGVVHEELGTCWLFRGFIDGMTPTYSPIEADTVELACIDALGEVNRAKLPPLAAPAYEGDTVDARITRLLDLAKWPTTKRDLQPTGDALIAHALGGQLADLLGQAADSGGGAVFGDLEARVAYRPRDWQTYVPGTPVDGTIGNVEPTDVCPVRWERPFNRADLTTRVLIGRDVETAQVLEDLPAQVRYGIEPFERTDLLTASDAGITQLGRRILRTRSAATAPRVRSVTLDARTSDDAMDLMSTVDVYQPSRYRCRLQYPRGEVFDVEHFATGVAHEVTTEAWSLDLNLDLAEPYAAVGGRWDGAMWDQALWADVVLLAEEMRAMRDDMNGART